MKVLVTGGAGFIGSHLTQYLLDHGYSVMVLDDLSTGQMANIDSFREHAGFEYRIGSVTDVPLVAELVDRCDATVHLAAAVGVRLSSDQPIRTIETNIRGTEAVLHAAAKKQKLVVVASTSEVYGKSAEIPFSEDDDLLLGATIQPRWAYGCSKALDEWLALSYWAERNVPVIIPRFFNTVGPRQTGRYGMVLPTFAAQAIRHEPIHVFGCGDQSRCFASVHDVVQAVVALIETPAAVGEVVNIGADSEVSILQLAHLVRELADSTSLITLVPYSEAYPRGFEDLPRRVPDVRKLKRLTGLRFTTPLWRIVEEAVAEQRSKAPADAAYQPQSTAQKPLAVV